MTQVWFDYSDCEQVSSGAFAQMAALGAARVLLRDSHSAAAAPPDLKIARLATSLEEVERAAELGDAVLVDDAALVPAVRQTGRRAILRCTIGDERSLDEALAAIGSVDALVIRSDDPSHLSIEMLLARSQGSGTHVLREVETTSEGLAAAGVLEAGVDGVVVAGGETALGTDLLGRLTRDAPGKVELVEAVVTTSRYAGMGFRACVDTVSLLDLGDGLIVGSTSRGGLLVSAEVYPSPYVETRPFRVNAGAVHSYAWCAGRTAYLSELRAGSEVLIANVSGEARPELVGRVKIEVRPLRLVAVEAGGHSLNVFLQDDWHVRLFDAEGAPLNSTELTPGAKVLAYVTEPGRHAGIAVAETIQER